MITFPTVADLVPSCTAWLGPSKEQFTSSREHGEGEAAPRPTRSPTQHRGSEDRPDPAVLHTRGGKWLFATSRPRRFQTGSRRSHLTSEDGPQSRTRPNSSRPLLVLLASPDPRRCPAVVAACLPAPVSQPTQPVDPTSKTGILGEAPLRSDGEREGHRNRGEAIASADTLFVWGAGEVAGCAETSARPGCAAIRIHIRCSLLGVTGGREGRWRRARGLCLQALTCGPSFGCCCRAVAVNFAAFLPGFAGALAPAPPRRSAWLAHGERHSSPARADASFGSWLADTFVREGVCSVGFVITDGL